MPMIAIVGRPNVGKSTLFNRLIGERRAVVSGTEKTTRDRNYGEAEWNGRKFFLVDTGGFLPLREADRIDRLVVDQVRSAIAEADLILFLVDGAAGPVPLDAETAKELRREMGRALLVANKVDNDSMANELYEFLQLGLGEPMPISAVHGTGIADLLDRSVEALPRKGKRKGSEGLRIGIIGRPNVGKSSLVNAYLGKEQMIVSDMPGTTRDAVDTAIRWRKEPVVLVDTAGLKRRSKIRGDIDYYASLRALKTIERSDVIFLVLDGAEPVSVQDVKIGAMAEQAGKGVVVLLNKTDLELEPSIEELRTRVGEKMPFLRFAPVVSVSAITKKGIGKALDKAFEVEKTRREEIPTAKLNRIVENALRRNPPPVGRGKNQIYYGVQTGVAPPTFLFFTKEPGAITPAYRRYLARSIREKYPYEGTPVWIHVRGKK